jgi:hypothetical protein
MILVKIYLLVTAKVAPSLLILLTLMLEAISSSKKFVLRRSIQCYISKEGIF